LVLGKVGIKFLNKVKSWEDIKLLAKNVNRRLFTMQTTEKFDNMTTEEGLKCCQNTTNFVNPGVVWPNNASAYVMMSSAANAAWAFLAR
jgi:hypothetical protein